MVAGSVHETGDVAGGGGFRAGNGSCGRWCRVLCAKRVTWWVVAGSVHETGDAAGSARKTGDAAGGCGFRA